MEMKSIYKVRILKLVGCVVVFVTLWLCYNVGYFEKSHQKEDSKYAASKLGSNRLYERYKIAAKDLKQKKYHSERSRTDTKLKENLQKLSDEENSDFMLKWFKLQTTTNSFNKVKYKKKLKNGPHQKYNDNYQNVKTFWEKGENDKIQRRNIVRNCVTGNKLYGFDGSFGIDSLSLEEFNSSYKESSKSRLHSFEYVFKTWAWGHTWDSNHKGLNASGRGATLDWAQETMAILHTTINRIKQVLNKTELSMLDIPCGDMAWMSRFLKTRDDIVYTGIDIVPDLIKHHRKAFKPSTKWRFYNMDALNDNTTIGQYDIILCRTLLQHLYDFDVMKLLVKFSKSDSKFILLTNFPNWKENAELIIDIDNPGRFRKINLQLPPFSLSPPLCMNRDGPPELQEGWEHFLGLWQLPLQSVQDCEVQTTQPANVPSKFYFCGVS